MNAGKIYLVGAGPGDPGLITVRAVELLRKADCVIHDRLVNPILLKYAPADAEIIPVPKHAGNHTVPQDKINQLLIQKASQFETVVRLKGGDPCIFGRGGEEACALADADIPFEIIPGVTAAVAAADYCGIMLTDRDYSSQVIFATGHESADKQQNDVDFALLAKFNGSIVFYMAVAALEHIASELIKNGVPSSTAACVIADATLPTQRVIKAALAEISQKCQSADIKPPAIVIIGPAAESDSRLNWFMNKPLFGCGIIITRDADSNASFAAALIARGALPIEFPAIQIHDLTAEKPFQQAVERFANYDWLVFTSANGVRICFNALKKSGKDARVFGSAKIACIGEKTAQTLESFGVIADFMPDIFTSADLAEQLIRSIDLKNKKIMLLRSAIASEQLSLELKKIAAVVDDTTVYTTTPTHNDPSELKELILAGKTQWLTFGSPSSVGGFFEQINMDFIKSSGVKIASIGPLTSQSLKDFGLNIDIQANIHTIDGLIDAIENYIVEEGC